MTWLRKHLRALWVVFAIASVSLFCHIWLVEGAASGETVLLPVARADFSGETLKEGQRALALRRHFLWGDQRADILLQVDGVTDVAMAFDGPVPFSEQQMVRSIEVRGMRVECPFPSDPEQRELLFRVLDQAAQIEWRLLWERALGGTAAWSAALAAMLGLTWLLKSMDAHSKKETGQG